MMARVTAVIMLVLLSPLLAVLGLVALVAVGRPVLFRQERSGLNGRRFMLVKFRTMTDARDEWGHLLPDERRVTAFGRFLRRTRLDELPGLWNVVTGHMAFVGPRPLLPVTIEELGERGLRRSMVKPGLTGWSQVNGNTLLSLREKVELDLWYIESARWQLDFQILARTLLVMIGGEKPRRVTAKPANR